MQHSRIRYKEFLPPVLKPLALYFMENKSAVCVLALLPHDSKPLSFTARNKIAKF